MRIAVWQCEQRPLDVAGNLARLAATARQAASEGADLLLTPEMVLTGYAIGAEATRWLAQPADGPSSLAVAAIAAETGVALAYGYPELDPDGRIFNAAQLFDATGTSRARYRKTHLFGTDDRDAFSPGDGDAPVVELAGLRVGFLICYDVEFPEAARAVALAGAELLLVPTANMVGFDAVPSLLVPARAYENQLFVAYANACGPENTLVYGGLSRIAAPDGTLLAHAGRDEALLLADLSPTHPGRTLNTYLPDRRPLLYEPLTHPQTEEF